ncbi:MAG: hypothetical protein QG622_559 [Actinomycetota bacterium]|nr:hypothetical protein [Actinomycetota bacterium]
MRIGRINRTGAVVGTAVVLLGAVAAAGNAAVNSASVSYAAPAAGARWDYQIGGTTEYTPAPAVVSRDNGEEAWRGLYNICYVNAFQSQPGDRSLKAFWLRAGGSYVEDPNWPGEYMLDTRSRKADLVAAFTPVLRTCASKGFAAVEFDNLDSYERSKGGLAVDDNIAYVRELIGVAHGLGLATAQKNAADLAGRAPFDFALAESCLLYDECDEYTRAYSTVLDVEYVEEMSAASFQKRCAAAVSSGSAPSFVLRDQDVSAQGARQWCSAQKTAQKTAGTPRTTTPKMTVTNTSTVATKTAPTRGTWKPTDRFPRHRLTTTAPRRHWSNGE